MTLNDRISAFAELGSILTGTISGNLQSQQAGELEALIDRQEDVNRWFTPDNVKMSVGSIGSMLTREKLVEWVSRYNIPDKPGNPRNIGIVMAGNIPMVGFHDLLCVLLSGHRLIARTSSKEPELMKYMVSLLISVEPRFKDMISITGDTLKNFDAIIATGSNNTSRYFEYYFGKYPHIFRGNRNSVAVISGNEKPGQLEALGNDIFSYFGLGCRNVSKVMVPQGYNTEALPSFWGSWKDIALHRPYANNLNHQRALFIINRKQFTDAEFILLREERSLTSQVGVLHYEFYPDAEYLENYLSSNTEKIQVVVGEHGIDFGFSQHPEPWEYADNRDTLQFLNSL